MKSFVLSFAAFALAFAIPGASSAAQYTLTDLGGLGGTWTGGQGNPLVSDGQGINASGQVVGSAYTTALNQHAFLYDGTMHDLGTLPGGTHSSATGINASGQVTGYADVPGGLQHAFLYDGTMHDIGTLGGGSSFGLGINPSSQVTGYSDTSGGDPHAFVYDGTMHDLGTLFGASSSVGNAINASGQVTGSVGSHAFLYDGTMHVLGTLGGQTSAGNAINTSGQTTGFADTAGGQRHAFLLDAMTHDGGMSGVGPMHDLGTLGGTVSIGKGINDSDQVVGYSNTTGDLDLHAFVYDGVHGMVDLNSLIDPALGWKLQVGYGINNLGQIVGDGMIGGQTHAFLLTPVPEPSTWILLVAGGVALLLFGGRKNKAARPT